MNKQLPNPYSGNPLIDHLGPIPTRQDILQTLTNLPEIPKNMVNIPFPVRMHYLLKIRDLHLPSLDGVRLVETIDLMLRNSYHYRAPTEPQTWAKIMGSQGYFAPPHPPAMAAVVVGHSGVGKTQAIVRALSRYPQIITHDQFPRVIGSHHQVVWLSVDVPPSGKSEHLAANLMRTWDMAVKNALPDHSERFAAVLARPRHEGPRMLEEWRQVASSHFLGILHFDEVQNFFQLLSLEKRRQRKSRGNLELSIVEDKCLKWILTLINSGQFAVVFSGTPDGVGAFTKRLSTIQRIAASGYHHMRPFMSASDIEFRETFLPCLVRYQFVQKPLAISDELAELLIELSGGIKRLIVAFWFAGHRVAFERGSDDLLLEDFRQAATTYLSPIAPAAKALRSGVPELMSHYEDLISGSEDFLANFWAREV